MGKRLRKKFLKKNGGAQPEPARPAVSRAVKDAMIEGYYAAHPYATVDEVSDALKIPRGHVVFSNARTERHFIQESVGLRAARKQAVAESIDWIRAEARKEWKRSQEDCVDTDETRVGVADLDAAAQSAMSQVASMAPAMIKTMKRRSLGDGNYLRIINDADKAYRDLYGLEEPKKVVLTVEKAKEAGRAIVDALASLIPADQLDEAANRVESIYAERFKEQSPN